MKLRYEGFSNAQETTLATAYQRMEAKIDTTLEDGAAMTRWFGAADRTILYRNLRMMAAVVRDPARTITFVNRINGTLKVEYDSVYVSQLMPVGAKGNSLTNVFAYVFPVDRRYRDVMPGANDLVSHVGSGMRIYIGGSFFGGPAEEQAWTIYHELTHKVLATNDHSYDEGTCRSFAATPDKAMNNAENYGFFWRDC